MSGYTAVKRLAFERPQWIPVVQVCYALARQTGSTGFAGRWALNELNRIGWRGMKYGNDTAQWLPNLRVLVTYGVLDHRDTTRGGRRAYYTMADPEGVKSALIELGISPRELESQDG